HANVVGVRGVRNRIQSVPQLDGQVVVYPVAGVFDARIAEQSKGGRRLAQAGAQPAAHRLARCAANLLQTLPDQVALLVRLQVRQRLRVGHAVAHELPPISQTRLDDRWIVATYGRIERHRAPNAKAPQQLDDPPDADTVAIVDARKLRHVEAAVRTLELVV